MHDLSYQYGFTEDAGNFQSDNFGRGGEDSDPVIVECQSKLLKNQVPTFSNSRL
jgi:Fungalysin metallopeptidase (M36)